MKLPRLSTVLLLLLVNFQVSAFDTVDEQIDHYLSIFENGSYEASTQMLERLQWSGLSDPCLFDNIAEGPQNEYLRNDLGRNTSGIFAYQARALGYSGNEKCSHPDLLALMAERLKASYLQQGLDKVQSDTLAWFCKALGENAYPKYKDLLVEVVANSPIVTSNGMRESTPNNAMRRI